MPRPESSREILILLPVQIHVSPRHLQLTAAIHQAVAKHLGHLEELCAEIMAAHVVLVAADGEKDKRFSVKAHLALPGPDLFAEDAEKDLYVALERVTEKLARQLRKRKTARDSKVRHKPQRAVERSRGGQGALPAAVRRSAAL